MVDRFEFKDTTAVVTGAASGIGQALAEALSQRGVNLVLIDVDQAGLERVVQKLASNEIKISHYAMDITSVSAVAKLAKDVEKDHGGAALVFNNAGIAVGGTFDRVDEVDFDRVMDVNFNGLVRMTRAFLPQMKSKPQAQLVNVSSIFGIIAPPGQTAYCASKFAVRGFSMALAHELEGSNVGVTTIHPGGVNTNIADNAKKPADASEEEMKAMRVAAEQSLVMPPSQAADIILSGVERRLKRVLVGRDAHSLTIMERIFPLRYINLMEMILPKGVRNNFKNS